MPGSTISDNATDDSVLERDSAAPGLEQNTATAEKPDTVAVDTEEDVYAVITAALARRYSKEHADEKSLSAVQAINHPHDLRRLKPAQLIQISQLLREELITTVSECCGHFSASLGVVELTVALHYVFNTPVDRIIWDIGHQAYPHKMITGRRSKMAGIRQEGGISGFPTRKESHYDAFGVAHAGTSISAGLGMAVAASSRKTGQKVIAVIGDGAITEGMAFEALNHGGQVDADLLVIYNDNNMSISPNVGSLNQESVNGNENMPGFFKALGCEYSGPIDGHDVPALLAALRAEKDKTGVRVLHILTKKGKGYEPAEKDPVKYHAVSAPFNPDEGVLPSTKPAAVTYTKMFSRWICDSARLDDRVVAITPAMREGSGLVAFEKEFPDRYFDVGIAEQHAVTMAGGFACEGFKPVVAIYSTFLQRGYDQLIHDIALQDLDVLFAVDRGGLVGADGPTHHGSFDISYVRCIPNMVVMTPANEADCRVLLQTGLNHDGPALVRYPRGGNGANDGADQTLETAEIGKAVVDRRGSDVAILAFGPLLDSALEAGEELDATVVNMRFVKPLDVDLLRQLVASHSLLVTIEDNAIAGGAGSAVAECLNQLGIQASLLHLGLPDEFVEHGSQGGLHASLGLNGKGIVASVRDRMRKGKPQPLS